MIEGRRGEEKGRAEVACEDVQLVVCSPKHACAWMEEPLQFAPSMDPQGHCLCQVVAMSEMIYLWQLRYVAGQATT